MKILLLGRDGQVGTALRPALAVLGHVTALGRDACDFSDPLMVQACVMSLRPHLVVNAAAYTAVDKAETEPELAQTINGDAVGALGEAARTVGALVVHYSTDYVFDGRLDRPYREDDPVHPLNAYGRSKLTGEELLRTSGAAHFIFRTSWVYDAHGQNFLRTMLRVAAERQALRVVDDQQGAPTSAGLIASATVAVLKRWLADGGEGGTFHLTASGSTTWCGFARAILAGAAARGARGLCAPDSVAPISTAAYGAPAARPANSRLDTHKFANRFALPLPDWTVGLDAVLDQRFLE